MNLHKKNHILKLVSEYLKKYKVFPKLTDLTKLDKNITKSYIRYYFVTGVNLKKEFASKYPKLYKQSLEVKTEGDLAKDNLLKAVADFVDKYKRFPNNSELTVSSNMSYASVRHHFGTILNMKEKCRESHPNTFKNIVDETLFNKKNYEKLKDATKPFKRFVVTSAVTGCKVHKRFAQSVLNYCKKKNAMLLIIPITDPASKAGWTLDPFIGELVDKKLASVVFSDLELNSNIFISSIRMSSKQIDPTTGLDRIAKDRSFIYGSPKQRLKFIANETNSLPKAAMGTGAITLSDYDTEHYMSKRTAYLAQEDHKIGALIVETPSNKKYHFRQIQAEKQSGNFVDLGNYYKPNSKREKLDAELIKLGDWHTGDTCPVAKKAWSELVKKVKPNYIFMEDIFDGKCINHHEEKKLILQAQKAQVGKLNLESELKLVANELKELVKWPKKQVIITYSNHDDFLARWLNSGNWIKSFENVGIASELVKSMLEGKMPLQMGVEKYLDEATKKKLRWLKLDESFILNGIEQGVHGHKGPDGSRGSLQNLEKSYTACNVAHRHSPAILRDAWQAGTSTVLSLEYTSGASSWVNASIVQYPNGGRQIINSIKGVWRFREKDLLKK